MVRGIEKFQEHFRDLTGQYVLIGGAACELIMDEAGLDFRATKDLDIVLIVEALDGAFVRAFWEFIRAGRYQTRESSSGERRFYRFSKPADNAYPEMLELFARRPDMLHLAQDAHLTPIPIDEEISSLSAILLDGNYYNMIHSGKRTIEGIPVVGPEYLILLKARAWLDLTSRKNAGDDSIRTKTIAKHRNDVFRLYRVIDPNFKADIPEEIQDDMRHFLNAMESEKVDLKSLGIKDQDQDSILGELRRMYVHD